MEGLALVAMLRLEVNSSIRSLLSKRWLDWS
jgi:hypothetical protein